MEEFTPTSRTQVRRLPKRAVYDKQTIYDILDEAYICHVGFALDGQPFVIPNLFARSGDQIFLHGSAASRLSKAAANGVQVCINVTLVDGLVLARSAFHHSINYRSVVVLGEARLITDPEEKNKALHVLTNHIVPERWEEVRPPNPNELKGTGVVAVPLTEVSAKIRNGAPADDEEDYAIPVWAGVIPVCEHLGDPVPDGRVLPDIPVFDRLRLYRRK